MQVKIMIPPRVREYWDKYGGCEYAVNRLLQEVDWQNLPQTMITGETKTKLMINVTDETYLAMREIFGPRSNNISLSRLLTLYCDGRYAELNNWSVSDKIVDNKKKYEQLKIQTLQNLRKMLTMCDDVLALSKAHELIKEVHYHE